MARIRDSNNEHAKEALKKLRQLSEKGKNQLKKKATNHAEATIGKGLAKMRASLDPDS